MLLLKTTTNSSLKMKKKKNKKTKKKRVVLKNRTDSHLPILRTLVITVDTFGAKNLASVNKC